MKRIYHHYAKWEDWKAGQYDDCIITDGNANAAARLLRDASRLGRAMCDVCCNWRNSADHNLSDTSQNRRAWLGQAAVCFALGHPDNVTKAGWHMLSLAEQERANAVADEVIQCWLKSKEPVPLFKGKLYAEAYTVNQCSRGYTGPYRLDI